MNRMKLVLGDWSGDGHNICEHIVVDVNHTVEEVRRAYKASVEKTGISFHGRGPNSICTEYGDFGVLTTSVQELLEQFECPEQLALDFQDAPYETYTDLWFWFVKLSLPDIKYNVIVDDTPVINGYWNKELNETFGYGLFS